MALVFAALIDADILEPWRAGLMSVLVACNPVSLYQLFSFYVDGPLYALFVSIIAISISLYRGRRSFTFLTLFAAIVLLLNIKFTGVVDAGILLALFFVIFVRQEDMALFSKWFITGTAAVLVGLFLVGTSPYVTNMIRYQTPFYPLYGKGAVDLKPYNVPGNFINKNSAEIFFLSPTPIKILRHSILLILKKAGSDRFSAASYSWPPWHL